MPVDQLVQLADADEAEKVPTRQLEQTAAEEAEYVPAAHAPVTAERPVPMSTESEFVEAQYDPAGHSMQVVDPVED